MVDLKAAIAAAIKEERARIARTGGLARAEALSAKRRKEIAEKASKAAAKKRSAGAKRKASGGERND